MNPLRARLFRLALLAALAAMSAACDQQPGYYDQSAPGPSSASKTAAPTAPPAENPSETCRTTRDTMLGKRQTDAKLIANDRSREDEELLKQRISIGKIIEIPAGTRVQVDLQVVSVELKTGGTLSFRRGTILEGDDVNERGLIPVADIEPIR